MTAVEIDVAIKLLGALFSMPSMGLLVAVLVLPWVVLVFTGFRQERRFEGVVQMYENNVKLVDDYQKLVDGYKKIVEGQQDLIIHTAQVMTAVQESVKTNSFCPMVRKDNRP